MLATRHQQPGENLDEYLQALNTLSRDCNFKDGTATEFKEQCIRGAFIAGISSNAIRQR